MRDLNIRIILIGLLFCFHSDYFSQKDKKIVIDSRTKLPLDYVFIHSDDKKINNLSTKDGLFIFIADSKITSITFYKMGYYEKIVRTEDLIATDTVFLVEKAVELGEVLVQSKKIDTIVRDKRYYVDDYIVLPDNKFLILTSKLNVKGFEICYYDKAKGITQIKKIKGEEGEHFFTDCFRNIHLVTNSFARQVFFDSDSSFQFLPKYTRGTFDSTIGDCVLKLDTEVIMKYTLPPRIIKLAVFDTKQNANFLDYYKVSKHKRELFYPVRYNKKMQEMIDNAIADSYMESDVYKRENLLGLFFNKVASPLYAPMFLKNDTVVMFHFQENKIIFLSRSGLLIKTVELNEAQFSTIRDFEIIFDRSAQKFYMKLKEFDRCVIKQIDVYKGKSLGTVKIEKVFAKNIQIVNNRIYYLVKEKEWDDTAYLYQQN